MLYIKRKNIDMFILCSLFLISILPGIKYFGLFIQILLFFHYFLKKRRISLAILFFSFSCYGTSISIYSFKIIYGLFSLLILFNIKNVIRFRCNKHIAFFIILFASYEFIYGLLVNAYTQHFSFLVDAFTFFTFLGGIILFSDFTLPDCEIFSMQLYIFWMITSLFCIFFNYGFSSDVDFLGRHPLLLLQGEGASLFYFILLYQLFFSRRNIVVRTSLLIIYLVINFRLGTFGSMLILYFSMLFGVLFLMKFIYSHNKAVFFSFIISVIALFVITSNTLQSSEIGKKSKALSFKMKNITELFSNFSFSDRKKINMIPLSPYVRILEIINITHSSNPYSFLFGHGWGGYYNDNYYPFENKSAGKILGDADFPLEQRKSHIYTGTHNFAYPYLKYGILYFPFVALYTFLCSRSVKERTKKKKIIYCSFVFILGFYSYLGFTFQTALALGLLFSTHKNSTMPIRSHLCKER